MSLVTDLSATCKETSVDDLLDSFSMASERSLAAAEAAAESEMIAAAAAEEAAEAYLAAAAAVGTPAFLHLKDRAESAENNNKELSSKAASAYKAYFDAYEQSLDASAALEAAEDECFENDLKELDQMKHEKDTKEFQASA